MLRVLGFRGLGFYGLELQGLRLRILGGLRFSMA